MDRWGDSGWASGQSSSRFGRGLRRGNRRRRHSRLTWEGWLVVVGAIVLVVGAGWSGRAAYRAWSHAPTLEADTADAAELPAVSAGPPSSSLHSSLSSPPANAIAPRALLAPPASRDRFDASREFGGSFDPAAPVRLARAMSLNAGATPAGSSLRVEYSLDEALTHEVFEILRKGRVDRGHALVIDPRSGRLLVYASTDPDAFPADEAYPAASIVKVLTTAAMLDAGDEGADTSCVYRGNKYRLNRRRLDRPRSGRESDLTDALATSNNQCFSQWAVHVLGEERLRATFEHFGWLDTPALGHAPGRIETVENRLDLGRLGSGLDGLRVTPLHVAALTTILNDGMLREPWWVDRVVDADGRALPLPPRADARRVLDAARAEELRDMMVATTTRGTAKSAFRTRRGKRLLGELRIAGKTGNLTGRDPDGRYEWFVAVAPADSPRIGVVVLQLQSNLWWKKSTELGASILREVFCERGRCRADLADRWTGDLGREIEPLPLSALEEPVRMARRENESDPIRR